ncbi:hypothetical protein JDV02_009036 [Purpureocillium takamizusanense]|uniref:Uncharacterized protein n=1 Tax=Purpureocillium takamizusanense TaxID=2060973 RepID=A0A9Q8QR17_9HYPO|nr:uncharacterized protein JDV02_009036 [Purpureocillium takamizusanense]UNI23204.1 hypothetical protein JDV02_009036 [Purpureocillium takamizusanense]
MRRRDSSASNSSKTTTASSTSSKPRAPRPAPINPFAGDRRNAAPRPPFIAIHPPLTHPPSLPSPRHSLLRRPPSNPNLAAAALAATAASSSGVRQPLRPRDGNSQKQHQQNVPLLTPTTTTRSTIASAARMPVGDRPRQPQLSAAAARSVNRTPITPKIAAKTQTPVTPLAARRPQSVHALRDDASTPAPSVVGVNNITPRSGARQSRTDSINNTPTGTPNPERSSDGSVSRPGLGASSNTYDGSRRSGDSPSESGDSNKFFYASDAKSMNPAGIQRPASVPQKPVTFFYANGITVEKQRNTSPPSNSIVPALAPVPEPMGNKFFYANGAPDLIPMRPNLSHSGSGSTVSVNSRPVLARPATSHTVAGTAASAINRPLSPVKTSTPTTQALKGSPLPPLSPNQPSPTTSPPILPGSMVGNKRRVSIDAAPKLMHKGHSRAGSVPVTEPIAASSFAMSPNTPETVSPPLSPDASQRAMTMASILQAADELSERDDECLSSRGPQSPTKSTHMSDSVSELVANARRERKVQDLEITNASLEAINRTLERQLRKQTAELRRFRRLSRSGRISLASGVSSRVVSAALTDPPVDLTDLTEEESSQEEDSLDSLDDSDLSSEESTAADSASPNAKMAARRKRDEKRLQLDLSKHQELLIDSQKMNQSLKRCLNWTEDLIKEGQKALAYKVRVSDVHLGGRVLAPPDEEDEDNLSFVDDATTRIDTTGLELPWNKGPQDRDSGIELAK